MFKMLVKISIFKKKCAIIELFIVSLENYVTLLRNLFAQLHWTQLIGIYCFAVEKQNVIIIELVIYYHVLRLYSG